MVEALGVPHTEVELVLVNGESVNFERVPGDGDRVAVYPKFKAFDITPQVRVRERTLRATCFVADAHLDGLAHLLRVTGLDALYDNNFRDDEIERIAAGQGRIVLTRDRELLKRLGVMHGCYVRALRSELQLREVFDRLDLAGSAQPFTRCLSCNAPLRTVDNSRVAPRLPPGVCERYERLAVCDGCARVFWEGTHWRRMRELVDSLMAAKTERRSSWTKSPSTSASASS